MNNLTQSQIEFHRILSQQFLDIYERLARKDAVIKQDDIQNIENTIQDALFEKIVLLSQLLRRNEELSKQLVQTKMEIHHFSQERERQEMEIERLLKEHRREKKEFQQYQERIRSIQKRNQFYIDKKDQLAHTLEQEQEKNQQVKSEIIALQETEAQLHSENAKHRQQISFLEQNIAALRQMKEDNMLSVMNLTNTMKDVSSGKDSE